MGRFTIIGAGTGLLVLAGTSGLILTPSAVASTGAIAEWGKPDATGGPGPTPTVVHTFANAVQIDAGNASDLVVLSDDYFTMPIEAIPSLESVLTLVGGRPVYRAASFTS